VHKLLMRQLRRHFGSLSAVPAELQPFIDAVDSAYRQADDDRSLLEHSMETVSVELVDRYRRLQEALSESQGTQRALAEALAILEATIEATTDGLLVVDRSGRMIRTNRKFVELWRIPEPIMAGGEDAHALSYVLEQLEDPDGFLARVNELYDDPDAESYDTVRFRDQRVYERYSTPHRVAGEIVGRVWSFRDVTARLRLEEQLRQSQKMEAIGRLAGGVAHDFNNLLTVISGHLELALEDADLSPSQRSNLDESMRAAGRAAALTNQLLAFGRRQMLQPQLLDLNDVVSGLRPMLSRLIGEDILVQADLGDGLHAVLADRGQIEQVLVNLAVNARDAMPRGGDLVIHTRNAALLPECGENAAGSGGMHVLLSVRDTGSGIPAELRDRIFEPFFTTKQAGKGTGLGLATVYGIVNQSGGRVEIETGDGVGTTFLIYLPSAGPLPAGAGGVASRSRHADGDVGRTVLVAEDDTGVRRLVTRMLEQLGYAVIAVNGGMEALTLIEAQRDTVDLLLTDVVMPDVSGPELVRRLRGLGCTFPVLYMSGYTDDEIVRRGVLRLDTGFIQKPFTVGTLASAVQEALASADGASPAP
jgi:two-component system, cell cycle sensor histidine kinase and response regulator CckA